MPIPRIADCLALFSVVAACSAALARPDEQPALASAATIAAHEQVTQTLLQVGMSQRNDVDIRISGARVASGFSRRDCDGMLLVASLPDTAQGLRRLAPRIDLDGYAVKYLYRSEAYASFPGWARLRDHLIDAPGSQSDDTYRITVLAEHGQCGLTTSAIAALSA